MLHALRAEALAEPMFPTMNKLIDYVRADQAHVAVENVRILYLNASNRLLHETVHAGCIGQANIYPRQVVAQVLELGATALILVHNHPSGDPQPSREDISLTRDLHWALRSVGVVLHDHVVVASSGHTSMRQLGLL